MKQGDRSPGRDHILIGALVALAAIAASQRPLALTGPDLVVVSVVTLLSLAAGLGVRRALLRARGRVLPPAPHVAPLAGAEDQLRHFGDDGYGRQDDEHERDNLARKPTSAPRAAVPERPRGAHSARRTAPAAKRLAGASKD